MERYDELMAAVCQDDADRVTYGPLVRKAVLLEQAACRVPGLMRPSGKNCT